MTSRVESSGARIGELHMRELREAEEDGIGVTEEVSCARRARKDRMTKERRRSKGENKWWMVYSGRMLVSCGSG
jgi:hypothetical protein